MKVAIMTSLSAKGNMKINTGQIAEGLTRCRRIKFSFANS
jgi:hypothetical protein